MVVNNPTKFQVHSTYRSKIIEGGVNHPLIMPNSKKPDINRVKSIALKLTVKTLPFQPSLVEHLEIIRSYEISWGISLL